jgi:PAS domain S-box-containing protein
MAAVAALVLRALLDWPSGKRFPLLFAFASVVIVAWFRGFGPAVATTLAAAVGGFLFFHDHQWMPAAQSVGLLPFLLAALLVSLLVDAMRRAGQRADHRLALLREESLRREREQAISAQLRAIVESSGDAIASVGFDGRIASWNRAAEQIFGYSASEVLGRNISLLTPPDSVAEELQTIHQIRAGAPARQFETVRTRCEGAPVEISLTISPIHDPHGQLSGISYIARDITQRKQFEQRLLQTQKLESLGVLAGGMAHDFNNLLTGIVGNTSLAHSAIADQASRERLAAVLQACDHAALLVRQMLAYAGKGAFVVENLDLSREVEDMAPLLRTTMPRAIALNFQLAPSLPTVQADRSQFQQIVMNLVINAVESIEDRGIISIATHEAADARVMLEVTDTGCGMNDATRERIFDPFFSTKFTGRGLGLAAVMGIVRSREGEIQVQSQVGRGSVFRVILPARAAAAARVADA